MNREPIWIALLLSGLALAGCMGGGGGEAEVETSDSPSDTDGGSGGVNATATATASANATNETEGGLPTSTSGTEPGGGDDSGPETKEEERSGTAESTGIVILDSASEEVFAVEEGAIEFTLVVNASGGELDVCIVSPTASDCAEEFQTEEGEGAVTVTAPAEGDWNVQLSPAGTGPQTVQYELLFRQTLPGGDEDEGSQGQPTSTSTSEPSASPTSTSG